MKAERNAPTAKGNSFFALTVAAIGAIVAIVALAVVVTPRPRPVQTAGVVLSVPSPLPSPLATGSVPTVPPYVPPTLAMGNCPRDWSQSPDRAVLDACARKKGTATVQQQAAELATQQSQPYIQTIPNFTPVVQLPVPDYAKIVTERKFDPYNGAWPFQWQGATSVWQVGGVPNKDYTSWGDLYLVAYQGNGAHSARAYAGGKDIATTNENPSLVTMGGGDEDSAWKYNKKWLCPRPVAELYITSISVPELNIPNAQTPFPGLRGIVAFTTRDGQKGHFDLAQESWTFDSPAQRP